MRGRQILQGLFLSVVSVLVTIVAIEGCLRVVWRPPARGHNKLFCEYDPLLGWRNMPNKTGWHIASEYEVFEQFNSRGIRGPEFSYEKEKGVYRVLVLGDSFAEGYMVSLENRFSEVTERELNERGVPAQVINMGTGGYSTDQELLRFESEGVKYRPDIVVVVFCSNDVWYNAQDRYWRGYKPMFIIENEDSDLKLTNVPVPPPASSPDSESSDAVDDAEEPLFQQLKGWLNRNSSLYPFVSRVVNNVHWLRKVAIRLGLKEAPAPSVGIDEGVSIPAEFGLWQKEHSPEISHAWDITEAILLRLQESVEHSGGDLIVFYVPNHASMYSQEWAATKRKYGISDRDWSIEQVGVDLDNICNAHSILFIDPTKRFREVAGELESKGERVYYEVDGHWNVNGHRLVGEMLAEYIKDFLEQEQ